MTLEETAEQVILQIGLIQSKAMEITVLASLVCSEYQVGDVNVKFSVGDKQKMIQYYSTLKAQLESLVEELP